ncbi:hypothetical protein GCM10010260_62250 [Streptomyces filipinensis]|uniref:Uncharacterized protein n=1 Tax=Streptomyces filipinensis TaxID=66887 RepID=A0A918IHR8_9ACTN|nr:hypothetical protein GCM10010260_62250 [Streptomyces filipinensis]
MPLTAPVTVLRAFTDRPPETLSSSASEISTVSTWGVEFMVELPFLMGISQGGSGPLWGQTDGRDRGRPGPCLQEPAATPAMRWIKARRRGALPINQGSHLRT